MIALVGDGAMQMNNMAELITVAKYWQDGPNPHWVVCVLNNQDLNQVTWEQRVHGGRSEVRMPRSSIPDVPYHRFAELIGLEGIFVDNPDRLGAAWEEALAADRPVVLEVKTDPERAAAAAAHHAEAGEELHSAMLAGEPDEAAACSSTARRRC